MFKKIIAVLIQCIYMNSMPYQHSIYALPQSSVKFHQEVIPCQICFVFSASRQLAIKPV